MFLKITIFEFLIIHVIWYIGIFINMGLKKALKIELESKPEINTNEVK